MFFRNISSHSYSAAYFSQNILLKKYKTFFSSVSLKNGVLFMKLNFSTQDFMWKLLLRLKWRYFYIFLILSFRNVSCKSKLNLHLKYASSFFFYHWLYLFWKLNSKWRGKYVRPALHERWICHAHQIQIMIWNFQILLFFYRVIYKNGSSTKSHDQT